eukprot:m.734729 g.734729  ORF g.734729 m.734729 type:complete len:119 (-) comp23085_c0_seq20:3165-3521(-)
MPLSPLTRACVLQCHRLPRDYDGAKNECEATGARLCTRAELESNVARGSGCGNDRRMTWSHTACTNTDAGVPDVGGGDTYFWVVGGSSLVDIDPICTASTSAAGVVRCCADDAASHSN